MQLKTRAQILANTKKWRKPETIWAAANQEERVRSRSKKERITYGRSHLASPFLSSFLPPRISLCYFLSFSSFASFSRASLSICICLCLSCFIVFHMFTKSDLLALSASDL